MKIKNTLSLYPITFAIAVAQNGLQGKTSQWHIVEQTDLASVEIMQQTSIVIVSDTKVSWESLIDNAFPMSITKISGTWNATTNVGNATYSLQMNGGSGTALVFGDEIDLSITSDITFSNGYSKVKLKTDNITYN